MSYAGPMDRFRTIAGGIEVEYAEQGAGTPLVLLHGWAGSLRIWRHTWPRVIPRWRVAAPDLPGWGESDKSDAPYTPEWYAQWLRAFLDARGAARADIVAHSMAALMAVHFAVEDPRRVRKLVLVTPPADGLSAFSKRTRRLASPLWRRLLWWLAGLRFVRRAVARDFTALGGLDDGDVDAVVRATYKSMTRSLDAMLRIDLRPRLQQVRVPTLVVGASRDTLVAPAQSELAALAIPQSRYAVIEDSGHCPMLERPEEFNRVVVDFLGEGLPKMRPP